MIKKNIKNMIWVLLCVMLFPFYVQADMEIHFLDVGQGLAVLISSDGQNMIYDGGGRDSSSFVVSYLKGHGVDELKYMVASHYDEDHIAGLIGCLNVFQVDEVIGPDYTTDTEIFDSFMNTIRNIEGLSIYQPEMGAVYTIGSAQFTVLSPEAISDNSNDNSIAILLKDGDSSFIFTGDLESSGEMQLVEQGKRIQADVLCVGHHGSSTCTSEDFLNAVDPQYAVISCGAGNAYGHPNEETIDKLNQRLIQILRTDIQGTLVAYTDGNSISWSNGTGNDEDSSEAVSEEPSYVLNTNTKKFHYPHCKSVSQMKEDNRQDYYGTKEELLGLGYDPCGNCKP